MASIKLRLFVKTVAGGFNLIEGGGAAGAKKKKKVQVLNTRQKSEGSHSACCPRTLEGKGVESFAEAHKHEPKLGRKVGLLYPNMVSD